MIEVECPLDPKFPEGRASVAPEPNSGETGDAQ